MLDIMSQAKDAIDAYNTKLRAISANITNMSVPGFKRSDISFEEVFTKVVKSGTDNSFYGQEGGTNPQQAGGTAAVANSAIDFRQGDIGGGGNLDLAIQGSGLFVVSPDGGNTFYYTRNGQFTLSNNKLLTNTGMQVYGFKRNGGVTSGQLEAIDLSGQNVTDPTKVTFDPNGVLIRSFDAGVSGGELGYQIALTSFVNPSGLEYRDGTNLAETIASGSPAAALTPGNATVGNVIRVSKEQSNVVYTSEIVDSLEMQRAISGSLTVVRMINDTISQFIQRLG